MNMQYLQATDPSDLSKQEGPYLVKCSQLLSDDEQQVLSCLSTDRWQRKPQNINSRPRGTKG